MLSRRPDSCCFLCSHSPANCTAAATTSRLRGPASRVLSWYSSVLRLPPSLPTGVWPQHHLATPGLLQSALSALSSSGGLAGTTRQKGPSWVSFLVRGSNPSTTLPGVAAEASYCCAKCAAWFCTLMTHTIFHDAV